MTLLDAEQADWLAAALASLDGKVMRQALDGRIIDQLATRQDGDGSNGVTDSLPVQD